jgi:glutathione S-transferase
MPDITIYVLSGSQYCAKVLCALDARRIEHGVVFMPIDKKKRAEKMPSGGTQVPEMVYDGEIVSDSDKILEFLDAKLDTRFFPSTEARDICANASTELNAFVEYYNWVDEGGYSRSMRAVGQGALPWVPGFVSGFILDRVVASARKSFRERCAKALKVDETTLRDEQLMQGRLLALLRGLEAGFASEGQPFLVAGATEPSAADFATFGMLERMVGWAGDAQVPPSMPQLRNEEALPKLWQWHARMAEQCPVRFKGKRASAAKAREGAPLSSPACC